MEADKILVDRLKELITLHENIVVENTTIVNKYKTTLYNLLGTRDNVNHTIATKPEVKNQTIRKVKNKKAKSNKKATNSTGKLLLLENTATSFIKEQDKPLTANELREKYNLVSGNDISISNFSPRVSELAKKGKVIKCTIEGNPIKLKFVYALSYMLEEGELKQEYLLKVRARQIQLY